LVPSDSMRSPVYGIELHPRQRRGQAGAMLLDGVDRTVGDLIEELTPLVALQPGRQERVEQGVERRVGHRGGEMEGGLAHVLDRGEGCLLLLGAAQGAPND